MKNAKLEGMQKGGNMMKKVFGIMMVLVMMASFIAVPASAESNVTLLETWFEDADGVKVYDTSAAKTVNPVFYVNNSGDAAVTDANIILASYDADKRLKSVNYATAPEIPVGESRIEIAETVDTAVGGETYMMIWKDYDPVVEKEVLSAQSREAKITSFNVGSNEGLITNEKRSMIKADSVVTASYSYEKTITVAIDADDDITAVVPEITVSNGATVSPASGEAVDFTDGSAVYTVTAADGTKCEYTVYVSATPYNSIYTETFGDSFTTFTNEELAALASKGTLTKTTDMTTASVVSPKNTPYFKAYKGAYGSAAALRYTRAEIAAGKEELRDGEYFARDEENNIIYYASTSATEPLGANDTTADTDIAYVLDRTGRKVMHADVMTVKDPANPDGDNYVFKYDKRKNSNTDATSFQYFQMGSLTLDKYTTPTFADLRFDFDLYLAPKGFQSQGGTIGFWHNNSLGEAFRLFILTNGNDIKLNYRGSDSANTAGDAASGDCETLKNGCGKWIHITMVANYTAGVFDTMDIYADNELIGSANYYTVSPSKSFGSGDRVWWKISAKNSSAKGYFYIDNIEMSTIFAQ